MYLNCGLKRILEYMILAVIKVVVLEEGLKISEMNFTGLSGYYISNPKKLRRSCPQKFIKG